MGRPDQMRPERHLPNQRLWCFQSAGLCACGFCCDGVFLWSRSLHEKANLQILPPFDSSAWTVWYIADVLNALFSVRNILYIFVAKWSEFIGVVDWRCKSHTDWFGGESTQSLSVFCCWEVKNWAACYWLEFWRMHRIVSVACIHLCIYVTYQCIDPLLSLIALSA